MLACELDIDGLRTASKLLMVFADVANAGAASVVDVDVAAVIVARAVAALVGIASAIVADALAG
eukprot:1439757-Prorocentrum_lima.AAC.1